MFPVAHRPSDIDLRRVSNKAKAAVTTSDEDNSISPKGKPNPTQPSADWDVFLSFHGVDRPKAKMVFDALSAGGLKVFFDADTIQPGEVWLRVLERGILEARTYMVLLSDHAPRRWVEAEAALAMVRQQNDRTFAIVPLLMDNFEFSSEDGFLSLFQGIRLAGNPADWGDVLSALGQRLRYDQSAFRSPETPQSTEPANPYPGLMAFDETSAHFFFGRSTEILTCLDRVSAGSRWLHIDGPSGSGKSSLARAGLVPAFRQGRISNAPNEWRVAIFRPGHEPLVNLAFAIRTALLAPTDDAPPRPSTSEPAVAAEAPSTLDVLNDLEANPRALSLMARDALAPGEGLLLVIDQLEEAFTLASKGEAASGQLSVPGDYNPHARFDGLIAEAITSDAPIYLITTIRSDFMARFLELPRLAAALNEKAARYYLEPMRKGLRQAVEGPATLAGVRFDPGLVDRILDDARALEGGLPLVAHVLSALWARRDKGLLTAAAYAQIGGVAGALAGDADKALSGLSAEDKDRARRMLISLVRIGRGSQSTRRPLPRAAVLAAARSSIGDAERVFARLSGGRQMDEYDGAAPAPRLLQVTDAQRFDHALDIDESASKAPDSRVDIVHEALLRTWPTLVKWIDEDRRALERRDDVKAVADAWDKSGRPTEGLPSGAVLAHLTGTDLSPTVRQRFEGILDSTSQQFLEQVKKEESTRHRKQRWRFGATAFGFAALSAAAAVIGVMAYGQTQIVSVLSNQNSRQQRETTALYMELGDLYLRLDDPRSALRYYGECKRASAASLTKDPSSDDWKQRSALGHFKAGEAHRELGELKEALREYELSIELRQKLVEVDDAPTEWKRELAQSHESYGHTLTLTGSSAKAAEPFSQALDLRKIVLETKPENIDFQREAARAHEQLGRVYHDDGQLPRARTLFERGLALRWQIVKTAPKDIKAREALGVTYSNLVPVSEKGSSSAVKYAWLAVAAYDWSQADTTPKVLSSRKRLDIVSADAQRTMAETDLETVKAGLREAAAEAERLSEEETEAFRIIVAQRLLEVAYKKLEDPALGMQLGSPLVGASRVDPRVVCTLAEVTSAARHPHDRIEAAWRRCLKTNETDPMIQVVARATLTTSCLLRRHKRFCKEEGSELQRSVTRLADKNVHLDLAPARVVLSKLKGRKANLLRSLLTSLEDSEPTRRVDRVRTSLRKLGL